jgi:hypothetical protein
MDNLPLPEKVIEEEVFSTLNINDDYDQLNQEKVMYTKFHSVQQQQQID